MHSSPLAIVLYVDKMPEVYPWTVRSQREDLRSLLAGGATRHYAARKPFGGTPQVHRKYRLLPAALTSCPSCGASLTKKQRKWIVIEILTRCKMPHSERVRIVELLFPEDTFTRLTADKKGREKPGRRKKQDG